MEWVAILAGTVVAGTPLVLAGLGELVVERSGVLNLGVEGMMSIGAVTGFAAVALTGFNPAAGLMLGALAGCVAALIFAFLSLSLSANQTACGLALTIFGVGLSSFAGQSLQSYSLPGLPPLNCFGLSSVPIIGPILFKHDYMVYVTLIIFTVVCLVLYKTKLGLILKAVGESPESAHAIGYPVLAIRYGTVLFGGLMAGLAGAYLSVVYTPLWVENMVAGRGWIAVALVVFAAWQPLRLLIGAYVFGGVTILQFHAQGLGVHVPVQFLAMMPYVATIVVLVLISRNKKLLQMNFPASLGKTFMQ